MENVKKVSYNYKNLDQTIKMSSIIGNMYREEAVYVDHSISVTNSGFNVTFKIC